MDENQNPTLSGGEESAVALENGAEAASDEGEREGKPDFGDAGRKDGDRQKHEFNAAMAAARRRAEKDTEERMSRQYDDDLKAMRIPNPVKPGSFFTSRKELEEYSNALRKADAEERGKKQGRSAEEIMEEDDDRAFLKELRSREETSRKTKAEQEKLRDFIARDYQEFTGKYPEVDVEALESNKAFRRFAGSRYGKEPLAELYGDYIELVGEAKAAEAAKRTDRRDRSTGGGTGGSAGTLTASQRRDLQDWNERYPEMKMTEAEYLKRGEGQ